MNKVNALYFTQPVIYKYTQIAREPLCKEKPLAHRVNEINMLPLISIPALNSLLSNESKTKWKW